MARVLQADRKTTTQITILYTSGKKKSITDCTLSQDGLQQQKTTLSAKNKATVALSFQHWFRKLSFGMS